MWPWVIKANLALGYSIPALRAPGAVSYTHLTPREYRKVQDFLFSLPLEGFVQELSSAQKDYIPSFELEGVEAPDQGNR